MLGNGWPAASPHEQPAPIASLAKVMTAYLTLERYPLSGAQDGFTITVTKDEAQAVVQDRTEGQSVVAVQAGEQLTERQLLEALLIPSGNNVGGMLAALVAGSETSFLAQMNSEARTLEMDHTTYTDPSGWDPGTVSTAADQLRIFQRTMRFPIFPQIVSTASATLPVAGTLTNFNPLIADGYACGSVAPAGSGRGSRAGHTNAVNHEKAIEVANARSAPTGSLPSGSTASRSNPDPPTSSQSSAPSPTGKLPLAASSPLKPTRRTSAGSTPGNPPARSFPRQAGGAPRSASASRSAPSSTGTLASTAHSPVLPTTGTPAGSTSAGHPGALVARGATHTPPQPPHRSMEQT